MKLRYLALSAAALASSACDQAPPESNPTPMSSARTLTLDEVETRLALTRKTQGLSSTNAVEVGRFNAYVTQVFEGISAPIDDMRAKCPEKVLSAKTTPLYGLEAPYAVRQATVKPSGVFEAPIAAVNPAVSAAYTGDYVIVDLDGLLISLFPAGVATFDEDGKPLDAGAKILREVSAVASLAPWAEEDTDGRRWTGVRLSASAQTPIPPPAKLKDALAAQLKEPCQ